MVIVLILLVYLVLGCILDSMSMLFLTVPVFYPIVSSLGYDLVWFGILVVTMVEVALITPPSGLTFSCSIRYSLTSRPARSSAGSHPSSPPTSSGSRFLLQSLPLRSGCLG